MVCEVIHTAASLIAFETRVAEAFEAKQVKGPIHLCSDGQAQPLIDYFRDHFNPGDWVCSNWRSHWHCLLAGMPEDELFAEILAGRSMYVNSAKYKIICSAIVGGVLPVAVGLAMGIARKNAEHERRKERCAGRMGLYKPDPKHPEMVHVFCGDMTATTGLFYETVQYVKGHGLRVHFMVENNSYSTNSRTEEVWGLCGRKASHHEYCYERTRPHTGIGKLVAF